MRVFYSQKTEQVIRIQLTQWRQMMQERLTQKHQDLSDNWKTCALGERIKTEGKDLQNLKDLSPEAISWAMTFP